MKVAEVYFMGGPADGTLQAVPCEDPMAPPRVHIVCTPGWPESPDAPVIPVEHVYRLQASTLDHGAAWIYVYAEEPTD